MENFHASSASPSTSGRQSIVGVGRALLLQRFHRRDDFLQLPDATVIDAEAMLVQGHRILWFLRRAHKVSLLLLSRPSKSTDDRPVRKNAIAAVLVIILPIIC
jgi:hypothetical protein